MTIDRLVRLSRKLTVTDGRTFRLKDVDPGETFGVSLSKEDAAALLREMIARIAALQETLYAENMWSVLLIFQAMDAAGKDSAIKHVFSGINPQGVQVFSFKAPSQEELDHDFLWRTAARLPERGRIGVFNRSYYEEVLVVRVRPDLLDPQRLPPRVRTKHIWRERFEDIEAFERHLARNGYLIRKFFLHVSRREQAKRFLERLDDPAKRWKFSLDDIRERERWPEYMRAYQDMIRQTSRAHAPWMVVPADRKWFARLMIAASILDGLESLNLRPPPVSAHREEELAEVRARLLKEAPRKGQKRR